jgi:hypothetical protein
MTGIQIRGFNLQLKIVYLIEFLFGFNRIKFSSLFMNSVGKELLTYFYNKIMSMNCMRNVKRIVNIYIAHVILTVVEVPWHLG